VTEVDVVAGRQEGVVEFEGDEVVLEEAQRVERK